jgi:ABC-type polysaccharide/polyol phosphate export permease
VRQGGHITGIDVPAPPTAHRHPDEGFVLTGPATPLPVLLRTLWRSRALLLVLAKKDLFVRYRRTSLGLLWALGLPLLQAVVLTVVFSHVVHANKLMAHPGGSYPVFLYSGLVVWSFVAAVLPGASTAIVDNLGLVTKIYFPRLLTVLLVVVSGLVPLAIGIAALLGLTAVLGEGLQLRVLWLLPGTALVVLLVIGLGATLSALHVYSRDVRYVVQAAMTLGFYTTPVIYPLDAAPDGLQVVLSCMPFAGPVELFRAATMGPDPGWHTAVLASVCWVVVVGCLGLVLQSRRDRVFVDLL